MWAGSSIRSAGATGRLNGRPIDGLDGDLGDRNDVRPIASGLSERYTWISAVGGVGSRSSGTRSGNPDARPSVSGRISGASATNMGRRCRGRGTGSAGNARSRRSARIASHAIDDGRDKIAEREWSSLPSGIGPTSCRPTSGLTRTCRSRRLLLLWLLLIIRLRSRSGSGSSSRRSNMSRVAVPRRTRQKGVETVVVTSRIHHHSRIEAGNHSGSHTLRQLNVYSRGLLSSCRARGRPRPRGRRWRRSISGC